MSISVESGYRASLAEAMARPASGDQGAALQAFLTLNAAYFLGEWLPARVHARLVRRLAGGLDGLADLAVPQAEPAASQLAQHARELAAAFGPSAWTACIERLTAALVPAAADRGAAVRSALAAAERGDEALFGDMVDSLLLAHARQRLWELAHPGEGAAETAVAPGWAVRLARRAVDAGDGRAIQVAEALLAEWSYAG